MKIKLFILTLFAVVLLEATLTNGLPKKASAEDDDGGGESSKEKEKKFLKSSKQLSKTKECQGKPWKPAKKLSKAAEECQNSDNDGDKREGPVCDAVCAWKKADVIQDEKFDKEELDKVIEDLLPGKLEDGREDLKKKWHKCLKKDFDAKAKDDHPKCMKWYGPLYCMREAFQEHCGNAKGGEEEEEKGGKGDNKANAGAGGGVLKFFGLG